MYNSNIIKRRRATEMTNQISRMSSERLCKANFAFLYAMRYFAYRYFYRFYSFFTGMNQDAQRVLAANVR